MLWNETDFILFRITCFILIFAVSFRSGSSSFQSKFRTHFRPYSFLWHLHKNTSIRIEILMAVINKIQDVFGTTFGLCGVVEMPNCGIWKNFISISFFSSVSRSVLGLGLYFIHYLEWAVQLLLPLVEIEAVVKLELG